MRCAALPGTSIAPSVIALGTAAYGTGIPDAEAAALLDAFVAAGGTFIDTAHVYGAWQSGAIGASERAIGAWLKAAGARDDVIIGTKGAHPDYETHQKRLRRDAIAQDLAESLERLGTDRVDVYWLHRDDPDVPVGEILGWLHEHVDAGLVRAIGCSNWGVPRMREAAAWADEHDVTPFCASQVGWSYARVEGRSGDGGTVYMHDEMLAMHRETGLAAAGFSSQASGFFAAKYDPARAEQDLGQRAGVVRRYGTPANYARRAAAEQLGRERGLTANQVAVAWLVNQPFPAYACVGATTLEQLADSCGAGDVELTPDQMARLNAAGSN